MEELRQPVLICIDTSGSMRDAEKKETMEKLLATIPSTCALTDEEKEAVNLCVLVFDDDVRTLVNWRPLTDFDGGVELDVEGCTSLGSAVIEAIKKTKEMRTTYVELGLEAKRPQIFVYTDGKSTESLEAAYAEAEKVLNKENPSATMFITLIPPAADPTELMGFGEKVHILKAKDCINGFPESFQFLQASVVSASQSVLGGSYTIKVPDHLAKLVKKGEKYDGTIAEETKEWIFQ